MRNYKRRAIAFLRPGKTSEPKPLLGNPMTKWCPAWLHVITPIVPVTNPFLPRVRSSGRFLGIRHRGIGIYSIASRLNKAGVQDLRRAQRLASVVHREDTLKSSSPRGISTPHSSRRKARSGWRDHRRLFSLDNRRRTLLSGSVREIAEEGREPAERALPSRTYSPVSRDACTAARPYCSRKGGGPKRWDIPRL